MEKKSSVTSSISKFLLSDIPASLHKNYILLKDMIPYTSKSSLKGLPFKLKNQILSALTKEIYSPHISVSGKNVVGRGNLNAKAAKLNKLLREVGEVNKAKKNIISDPNRFGTDISDIYANYAKANQISEIKRLQEAKQLYNKQLKKIEKTIDKNMDKIINPNSSISDNILKNIAVVGIPAGATLYAGKKMKNKIYEKKINDLIKKEKELENDNKDLTEYNNYLAEEIMDETV